MVEHRARHRARARPARASSSSASSIGPRRPGAVGRPARGSSCGRSASCARVRAELRDGRARRRRHPPDAGAPAARGVGRPAGLAPRLTRRSRPRGRGPRAGGGAAPDGARPRPDQPVLRRGGAQHGHSWRGVPRAARSSPGGRVAIDKPPVDLWLQVASHASCSASTPSGCCCPRRWAASRSSPRSWLLRTIFGCAAALAGGAGARRGALGGDRRPQRHDGRGHGRARGGRRRARSRERRAAGACGRWPLAGVLLGLAFEVKLAEALLPIAAAVLLWARRGRARGAAAAVALGLLGTPSSPTALAWLVVVTLVPLHPRPWALGASDGSPWRAALVYNGVARLPARQRRADRAGRRRAARARIRRRPKEVAPCAPGARARRRAGPAADPPGPLRLLSGHAHGRGSASRPRRRGRARALALRRWRGLDRPAAAGCSTRGLWLVAGVALCSAMPGLRPRYLACLDPAGRRAWARESPWRCGAVRAARRSRAPRCSARSSCSPLATAVAAVRHGTQASGARARCRRPASRGAVGLPARRTAPGRPTRSP